MKEAHIFEVENPPTLLLKLKPKYCNVVSVEKYTYTHTHPYPKHIQNIHKIYMSLMI